MIALYAATADAATGLRVFHFTGCAVVELLAIALDARRAIERPESGAAWGWARRQFDQEDPADDLQERLRAMDPRVIAPIVTTTAEQLVAAVSMSDPDHRMVRRGADIDPQPWGEVQSRLLQPDARNRLFQTAFRRGYAMNLVELATAVIRALHCPALRSRT
jgi:hypothetical protein